MDSRPLTAVLKALAESPVPVAEAYFDEKGNVMRLVLLQRMRSPEQKERDIAPKIAEISEGKKQRAISSLRNPPEKMSSTPERDP